ncbi:MAG: family 36 glycosyl transferase, partial [Paenibacillus sp.]|nr:family 36 glycosyl transferase [Paenibacillus sp.]
MVYYTEKLRQQARELALQHHSSAETTSPRRLWQAFDADIESLRAFVLTLLSSQTGCAQPAEEWLLDNAEFIEEQVLAVRKYGSNRSLNHLPSLRKQGLLRIQSICKQFIDQVDGVWSKETFETYIHAYQEISILTLAEIWSIPLMLRMTLIRKLAEVMSLVRERREVCLQVEQFLERIESAKLSPEVINKELEASGQTIPLSGPWVVHLLSQLREKADDASSVSEWLMCKFENGSEDLDRIVTYEHQLQAAYQITAGNLITSLRSHERIEWNDLFEHICLVDQTLQQESTCVYGQLDSNSRDAILKRVERMASRMRVPENLIAEKCTALANEAVERLGKAAVIERNNGAPTLSLPVRADELPRETFVAYYLLEPAGIKKLNETLRMCSEPKGLLGPRIRQRAAGVYFGLLTVLFALFLIGSALWLHAGSTFTSVSWIFVLLVLAIPVSEWVITMLHLLIECGVRPRPLMRYDYSNGVPREAATMVVIPVIWSTREEVQELADRLELHYLANRDANIHFALLGDFSDAQEQVLPEDEALCLFAQERIAALNALYASPGGTTFHFFQRSRQWNSCEGAFMGWERKRGKLVEFVELLRGSSDTSFNFISGDTGVLSSIRYIITLDADTQLPLGSAQRMIGTMHLPYNRPRLNASRTRVVEGYGVLQPRIGISHESALRSRLAHLSSETGFDPYAFAVSDPYQDALQTGIFTGKGIFDVDVFAELLCERVPDNQVLSHDLLEGGFLRAGLLSDIELIDDHPTSFSVHQKRLHRWVRGDWQLVCWLFPRVCDRRSKLMPVDLSAITRWQIIDNLRRSLLPFMSFALLTLGLTVLPGSSWRWLVIFLITMLLPVIRQLMIPHRTLRHPRGMISTFLYVIVNGWTLPFQSALLLDAIAKSLYRLFISKRRLLEWTSSFHTERSIVSSRHPALLGVRGGYVLILVFAWAAWMQTDLVLRSIGLSLSLLWALAPFAVRWLDQPVIQEEESLTQTEKEDLRTLAKQIWGFYDDFVGAADHWLPPDNVQIEPPNGVAHRTSPTNIGFLLTACLAARDFDFITTSELVGRLGQTIDTIERMEKWHGHLYNWYDTTTLAPLFPMYVSTVDSGNFVASLMTVKQGLATRLKREATDRNKVTADIRERGDNLITRLEALITGTDFRSLYDHKAKLFVLGYHADTGLKDTILYDLLASEARQTSFIAIALGQISVSHWMALGRTTRKYGEHITLISWSGTMFEYMMPWLLMRTYPNTLWDSTYRGVVKQQIQYARERGVPFGISESGYYAFDYQMNYQYRAFGVPGLGFKRGLEKDLVLAPYATVMALPFALREGLHDLHEMEKLGARGQYGFYEAIDCTSSRMPEGQSCVVIRSFMAHHQGMSLLTIANMLLPDKMYDYFHQDKRVQAAELLLKERIPKKASISHQLVSETRRTSAPKAAQIASLREFDSADTPTPELSLHSNGSLTTVITNSGGGFIRYKGMAVTRWREDPVLDPWGSFMYIRDVTRNQTWSPSFQPCQIPSVEQKVQFALERTTFMKVNEEMITTLEVGVSPELNAEIRRLTLSNTGSEARIIEVTTFLELVLSAPEADEAHPAFSKLFVETEYEPGSECLLARRRPRNEGEKALWAFHTLAASGLALGQAEYETDRSRFIGRGYSLAEPKELVSRLKGTVGAVADPAFIMRRRISIGPGEVLQLFAVTGVAETREQAIDMVLQLTEEHQVERAFQLSWTRSQIELMHSHITAEEAGVFQQLAGRALYASPLREDRKNSIAMNEMGQRGLWAHGISGDRPVVLVRIADIVNLPFAHKILLGHEYLRRNGLNIDLVFMNESSGGYSQDLQEALRRLIEQNIGRSGTGQAGVYVLPVSQAAAKELALIYAVSHIVLRANGPSLRAQLKITLPKPLLLEPLFVQEPVNRFIQPVSPESSDYLFFNGWGGFSQDGREYHIILKNGNHLPAPWINVIANPKFGCLVSELYTGYTWWRNSRECKITPWSNDPSLDMPGEICYVRDEDSGEYWTIPPARNQDGAAYKVSHGRGYTRFQFESHGLQQEMTVFVPLGDPVKVIKLRLHNTTSEVRRLSVTYYAEWVLGVRREHNASFVVTHWDEGEDVLLARNTYQEDFRDATAFLAMYPQIEALAGAGVGGQDGEPRQVVRGEQVEQGGQGRQGEQIGQGEQGRSTGTVPSYAQTWTGDREEFLGRNGNYEKPAAMARQQLSGTTGPLYNSCGAVQSQLVLQPHAEQSLYILLGCDHSEEASVQLAQKYRGSDVCEQEYDQVIHFWDGVLGGITVSTPSTEMDVLLNNWLLYQTLSCRMWARTAFYQAGGAYGFRDQLQDSLALLHSRPDLTRAQILLHAAHQYEEGDVQHWWHEETNRGIRTRFSDDLLWLPYAVVRYLEHTEDDSILDELAPYLHSMPLSEGEHERYETTV